MENKYNISPEQEAELIANRDKTIYVRTFEKDGVSYPIPGLLDTTRLIAVDRDTVGANDISFGFSEFAPKKAMHGKHRHTDCEEIMYVLSGRGVGGCEDVDCIYLPGDVIFVPRGAEHYLYNPFDEPLRILFLYTKPSLKDAGYSVKELGDKELGDEIEKKQHDGTNAFDQA